MRVVRHCRERLPGGERLWRHLAKKAGFTGTLEVIGYGVGTTEEAKGHRKYAGDMKAKITLGYFISNKNKIRVFLPAPCTDITDSVSVVPLFTFAHELGHYVAHRDETPNTERRADNYARKALRG